MARDCNISLSTLGSGIPLVLWSCETPVSKSICEISQFCTTTVDFCYIFLTCILWRSNVRREARDIEVISGVGDVGSARPVVDDHAMDGEEMLVQCGLL